jgi:hypothetical protein
MKKILFALAIFLLATLTGCAGPQTQAQREFEDNKRIMNEVNAGTNACYEALGNTEAGRVVSSEVTFARTDSPNRYELMASKVKLNDGQRTALRIFLEGVPKCRQIYMSGLNRVSANMAAANSVYNTKIDAIYLALLNGDFTIGDANVAKDKAFNERVNDFNSAWAIDRQRFEAMDNAEYAQRQRAAAIMMPYLMQQQAVQAQQQQNMYNQQMQQIQRNTPVYTPSINTTCTAIGNQINCTSR